MVLEHLVGVGDVLRRLIVVAEDPVVLIGILVPRIVVRVEAQRLVITDRERALLRNVRLEQLCSPPAVIRLDERQDAVVQEARQNQINELDVVAKFMPYLTGQDEVAKVTGGVKLPTLPG